MSRRFLSLLTLAVALTGCSHQPVIDMASVKDPQQYQKDLIECHTLADMGVSDSEDQLKAVGRSAAIGLVTGINVLTFPVAIVGANADDSVKKSIMQNVCLIHRGYNILNREQLHMKPRTRCMMLGDYEVALLVPQSCIDDVVKEDRFYAKKFGYADPWPDY